MATTLRGKEGGFSQLINYLYLIMKYQLLMYLIVSAISSRIRFEFQKPTAALAKQHCTGSVLV